jgi:hypothetical protein
MVAVSSTAEIVFFFRKSSLQDVRGTARGVGEDHRG